MNAIDTKQKYQDLLKTSNRNAIVARGMVEHFLTGETKLKACQLAAAAFAQDLGFFIATDKPNITSPVGRLLRDADVFQQLDPREKRTGYVLHEGPRFDDFADFLEEDLDYGTRLTGTFEEDLQRHAVLEHLKKTGAVRANRVTNAIPPKGYKMLSEMLAKGELDVVFIYPDSVAGVKHNGVTEKIGYFVHD